MNQIKSAIKYIFSFFKSEWKFDDYPVETWINPNAGQDDIKFGAKFTNWHPSVVHGNSAMEAIENLKSYFLIFSKDNKLPRPGSKVSFEFAESSRIEQYEEIAVDFFEKIIGINYYECFISDFSSLAEFDLDNAETLEKIKTVYEIEPNSDLFFADIFEQIKNKANS